MSSIHVITFHAKNFCRAAIREGLENFAKNNGLVYTEAKGMLTSVFRIEAPNKETADILEQWIYATAREAR